MAQSEKRTGKIKRLVEDKKFGFIRDDVDSRDRFFHVSGLLMTTRTFEQLREGDSVEYTHVDGDKGPRAIEVRVI